MKSEYWNRTMIYEDEKGEYFVERGSKR